MPVAFLTAWYALARAEVGSGDRVVVTAAAGGVGTALLQLISLRGARALALVGSESKLPLCRELRAVDAGLYSSADQLLARHFHGRADAVIDAIGGRLFRSLWRRLDRGGRYVLYGFAAAAAPAGIARAKAATELLAMGLLAPYRFVQTCRTLIGFNLSLLPTKTGKLRRAAAGIFDLWEIRPNPPHPRPPLCLPPPPPKPTSP